MDYKLNKAHTQRGGAAREAVPTRRGEQSQAAGAALGIVTKTSSPCFETTTTDGEILKFNYREDGTLKLAATPQHTRALRWQLKSVVNRLLPESRTSKCHLLRSPATGGGLSGIEVRIAVESNKAFYSGLMACGSVWNCPVCSAKISERRRLELQSALEIAKQRGYMPFLVTLTNSHGIGDDLFEMKQKQQDATTTMSNGKNSVKNTLARSGIIQHGFIRTYEVTHGKVNGFHPHFHLIVFVTSEHSQFETRKILKDIYFKRWHSACVKQGLPEPSEKFGVDVKDGSFAAKYAAKWGLAEELTKTLHKKNKNDGLSPWGLLQAIYEDNNPDYPRNYASGLFYVYSRAMSNARQLYWSNGLRKLLGMTKELDDETVAQLISDDLNKLLSTISYDRWIQIRRSRSEARVLEIAETAPMLLSEYLSRFDTLQTDQDKKDPLHLEIFYPKFDVRSALSGFQPKVKKRAPLMTIAQRKGLSRIVKLGGNKNPLKAGQGVEKLLHLKDALANNRK